METRGGFLVYPKNQRVLDGSSRVTVSMRRNAFVLCALSAFLFTGCFFVRSAIVSFGNWHAWRQLRLDGIEIQATVRGLSHSHSPWRFGYFVDYEFEIDTTNGPTRFRRIGTTNEESYSRLLVGEHVLVMYSGRDPTISRIPGGRTPDDRIHQFRFKAIITGILAFGFVTLPSFAMLLLTCFVVDGLRLMRHGRIIKGHVVACSQPIHHDGLVKFEIDYQFTSPRGTEVSSKQEVHYGELAPRDPPSAGTELYVFYVDQKCHELL